MRVRLTSLVVLVGLASTLVRGEIASLPERDLASARKLYVTKCVRCHKNYDPAEYSESEWQEWMHKMSRKAHLTSGQAELLSRYTDAVREPGAPEHELLLRKFSRRGQRGRR